MLVLGVSFGQSQQSSTTQQSNARLFAQCMFDITTQAELDQLTFEIYSNHPDVEMVRLDLNTQRALEIMQINNKAIASYYLKPVDLKINLFRAKQVDEYVHDKVYMGWKPFALNGIDIHDVPGDHYSIFSAPNDKVFAEVLQKVLDGNTK